MKKVNFKIAALILGFLAHFGSGLWAQAVSRQEAQLVARNYLFETNRAIANRASIQVVDVQAEVYQSDTVYYMLNLFPEGWVIVSADRRSVPVLGSSSVGRIDFDNLPPAFETFMLGYKDEIKLSRTLLPPASFDAPDQAAWQTLLSNEYIRSTQVSDRGLTSVGPLLGPDGSGIRWSQSPRYNNHCPTLTQSTGCTPCTGNAVTGCVATAMGQAMRYFNHPATGQGSHTYQEPTTGVNIFANFGTTNYSWTNMPNILTAQSTNAQINAVAQLLFHCGVSVNMDYGQESGANTQDAAPALRNHFRYATETTYQTRGTNSSTWASTLTTQLNNNTPVIYRGSGTNGGHAWVCDGWRDVSNPVVREFHMNWGWEGTSNGWFNVTTNTGSPLSNFTQSQGAVINISPRTAIPTGINASDGAYSDKVVISWSNGGTGWTNATQYKVFRNTSNNTSGATAISSWISTTSFNDNNAAVGTTYYYFVKAAKNTSGLNESEWSSSNSGYRANNTINVSPTSTVNVGSGSGSTTFSVSGNVNWTASDNATWLTISPSSGYANTSYALTATYSANTSSTTRTATLTVTGSGVTVTRTIVQAGTSGVSNDNPCNATNLNVGSSCSYTNSTTIGATTTTNPAANSLCYSVPSKDVWFKATVPASGIMTIRTIAGTLTDAVMALYVGSCSSLTYTNICEDDNNNGNGSAMPVISVSGPAGTVVYIRVWGYNGTSGTFQICTFNYQSTNFTGGGSEQEMDDIIQEGGPIIALEGISATSSTISSNVEPDFALASTPALIAYPNPANTTLNLELSAVKEIGTFTLAILDNQGRVLINREIKDGTAQYWSQALDVSLLPPGIYLMRLNGQNIGLNQKIIIQR